LPILTGIFLDEGSAADVMALYKSVSNSGWEPLSYFGYIPVNPMTIQVNGY